MASWGDGWGTGGWGGPVPAPASFAVSALLATRENVIRVQFSQLLYFSTLLDQYDGSIATKYTVTATAGGVGIDALDVHSVKVAAVQLTPANKLLSTETYGKYLDIILDRPMSPFPCQYDVAISPTLMTTPHGVLLGGTLAFQVYGLLRLIDQPNLDIANPSRDIANPQTLEAEFDPLPFPNDPLNLGTINVDEQGDYAFDEGIISLKKRILRRLISIPNGFAHLPGYGVGIPNEAKKLAQSTVISRITSEAEKQIAQEPEVIAVRVRGVLDARPGLVRFIILVRTRTGGGVRMDVPFDIAA